MQHAQQSCPSSRPSLQGQGTSTSGRLIHWSIRPSHYRHLHRQQCSNLRSIKLQASKQRRALDPDKRPPKPNKEPSQQMSGDPSEPLIAERDEVPEEVNARVLQRILIFAGVPVFSGILLLPLIVYLKTVQKWDIPNWAVLLTQTFTFGAGFLGISYGALSASWEPNREGSLLGFNEFKANLALALEDLRRRR